MVIHISEESTSDIKYCPGCGAKWEKSPCKICGMLGENVPPAPKMDEMLFRAIAELNMKLDIILTQQKRSSGFGYRIGSLVFSFLHQIFNRRGYKLPKPKETPVETFKPEPVKVIIQPYIIPSPEPPSHEPTRWPPTHYDWPPKEYTWTTWMSDNTKDQHLFSQIGDTTMMSFSKNKYFKSK